MMFFKNFLLIIIAFLIISNSVSASKLNYLKFTETEIHSVISVIAQVGGISVSVDDSVSGTITIVFNEIEPIDALKLIAKTKDLKLIEENGAILMTYNYNSNSLMKTYVLPIKYGDVDKLREAVILALDLRKDDENEYF